MVCQGEAITAEQGVDATTGTSYEYVLETNSGSNLLLSDAIFC